MRGSGRCEWLESTPGELRGEGRDETRRYAEAKWGREVDPVRWPLSARPRRICSAFLTQTTISGAGAPVLRGSRVEVTMAEDDGTWLIAGLEPV